LRVKQQIYTTEVISSTLLSGNVNIKKGSPIQRYAKDTLRKGGVGRSQVTAVRKDRTWWADRSTILEFGSFVEMSDTVS
jgi:hypothetical protein